MRARSCAGSGLAIACSAAASARLVSSAPPFAILPTTSPEYGERTSVHSPVSTRSPPIRSGRSIAVAATRSTLMFPRALEAVPADRRAHRLGRGDDSPRRRARHPDAARHRLPLARPRDGRVLAGGLAHRARLAAARRDPSRLRPPARRRGRPALPRARDAADPARSCAVREARADGLAAGALLARAGPPALVGLRGLVPAPDALLRDLHRRRRDLGVRPGALLPLRHDDLRARADRVRDLRAV